MVQVPDHTTPAPPYTEEAERLDYLPPERSPFADRQTDPASPQYEPTNATHAQPTVTHQPKNSFDMDSVLESLPSERSTVDVISASNGPGQPYSTPPPPPAPLGGPSPARYASSPDATPQNSRAGSSYFATSAQTVPTRGYSATQYAPPPAQYAPPPAQYAPPPAQYAPPPAQYAPPPAQYRPPPAQYGHPPRHNSIGNYQNNGSSSKKSASSAIMSAFGGGSKKSKIEEVYVAVMGVTGAGKSSFISLCTKQKIVIGHDLMSCTMEVEDFTFMWNSNIRVHLIDTPGFDDSKRKDTDVLRDIAGWMAVTYTNKIKLSGIIYLHRITDSRMGGTQLRNLTMFKELCGKQCFPAVTLATTFWGDVNPNTGADRERELISKDEFWGYMARKGSQVVRHLNTRDSAMNILEAIVKRHTTIVLDIQDDMVNKGLDLDETLAGQSLNRELIEQQKKHREELHHLEEEMRKAIEDRDAESVEAIAQMQKEFTDKINQGNKDVQDLQASLESLKEERDREFKKIQDELEQRAAEYALKQKEWDDFVQSNAVDPAEVANREAEMNQLRQQLKDLIDKGERKKTGVWYQVGEFFEEVVDDIKKWWNEL